MITRILYFLALGLVGNFVCQSAFAQTEILFQDDFETGDFSEGTSPVFSWKGVPNESNIENAMMRGNNDIYGVSSDRAYRGQYSLRLNFGGRNGFCNACGSTTATLNESSANSGCFTPSGGGPFADHVFNKSNGFSRWSVTSVQNGQVCINKNSPEGGSVFANTQAALSAGDEIKVPYRCGTNGSIGNNPERRSDCNKAINYLSNVGSNNLDYGDTIARRFYIFLPAQTQYPSITFKLGYAYFKAPNDNPRSSIVVLSVQRNFQLGMSPPNGENIVEDFFAEKDKWYYFEETFRRESGPGMRDAQYRLYVGEALRPATELTQPIVTRTGFEMGELRDISINGNWQHKNDVSGYVYFDDIVIAKSYIGPTGFDPNELPAERVDDLR